MSKTTELSGHLVQYAWSDRLYFVDSPSEEQDAEIYHRPITVQVPISTLKFDPTDEKAKGEAHREHKIEVLHIRKARLAKEIAETDEEIQSLLALPPGH